MKEQDKKTIFKKLLKKHLGAWSEENRKSLEEFIIDLPFFDVIEISLINSNEYYTRWSIEHLDYHIKKDIVISEKGIGIAKQEISDFLNDIKRYKETVNVGRKYYKDKDISFEEIINKRKDIINIMYSNELLEWFYEKDSEIYPILYDISVYKFIIGESEIRDDLWETITFSHYMKDAKIIYRPSIYRSYSDKYIIINEHLCCSESFSIHYDEQGQVALYRFEKAIEKYDAICEKQKNKNEIERFNKKVKEKQLKIESFYEDSIIAINTFYSKGIRGRNKLANEDFNIINMSFIDHIPEVDITYTDENNQLVIFAELPLIDDIPNIKKAVLCNGEVNYQYHTKKYIKESYEQLLFKYVILLFHFVFKSNEYFRIIDRLVLNGYVKTVDKATGKKIEPVILSVESTYEDFKDIAIEKVNPKEWFKAQKGLAAAKIEKVVPVAPIMDIDRSDKRFVCAEKVKIGNSTNLAAIDWKEFENLIRELFEMEFKQYGGEVKVTQASRDGGVDAVAFDPDPIRGGKLIIQAKRYTNIVGVSAVRDLYGTVLNEGANKGILVTTSDYGTDSYEFAKGKPITLINGANLLFLLNKHGYEANIDIEEARKMLI